MDSYLMSLSIGPVQDFIAAARRTADLFAGSWLLQRVTDAAAATLPTASADGWGVGRVFPADLHQGGSNKILAVVTDPAAAARDAELAARRALVDAWTDATGTMGEQVMAYVDQPRARQQVEEFLEFYAAWVPVTEATYAAARIEVEGLLAGTKALRGFRQQLGDDAGVMNSGLDPSRPNVIAAKGQLSVPAGLQGKAPLWLKSTEVLDAVSLAKRALSAGRSCPLGRVLSTRALAQRSVEPGYTENPGVEPDEEPDAKYFAVLVADGDRMGGLLGRHESPGTHRVLARKLDEFSRDAAARVEEAGGQLVYAGGDDVLALVPVTRALACAEALAGSFTALVPGATLSAGIAVVHYKEPLSHALRRGREAERVAKTTRNSVCVALHKRSGGPVKHTEMWGMRDGGAVFAPLLGVWLAHHRAGRVTLSLPFALRQLALEFPEEAPHGVLAAEVGRLILHSESEPVVLDDVPALTSRVGLEEFVRVLLVTRFLSGVEHG